MLYVLYYAIAFLAALLLTKSLPVAFLALVAITIQFFGYGYGFLKGTIAIEVFNKDPKTYFPKLFFN